MEVVQLRTKSAIGIHDGAMLDYHRQYRLRNKDKRAEYRLRNGDSSGKYYLQNKDKQSEYYSGYNSETRMAQRRDGSSAQYSRLYFRQNKEKNSDYYEQRSGARGSYYRQYNRQNQEKNAEFRTDDVRIGCGRSSLKRSGDAKVEHSRRKERDAEFRTRNDGALMEYRRGKKEYYQLYHGYQKSNQSWKTPDIVREYFESIASRLNISSFADWYRISRKQMDELGGLPSKFGGSLGTALQFAYPEIEWNLSVFRSRNKKKAGQRWLKSKIEQIMPGIKIVEDYLHPELNWDAGSDRNMELDLWLPQHRIGVEYQGEQHYCNVDVFGPSSGTGAYGERDEQKNSLCESRGITLVVIPYWWDGSVDTLSATLYQARPDVFPASDARPIPREFPFSLNKWNPIE